MVKYITNKSSQKLFAWCHRTQKRLIRDEFFVIISNDQGLVENQIWKLFNLYSIPDILRVFNKYTKKKFGLQNEVWKILCLSNEFQV
jgi:hypothetical protein